MSERIEVVSCEEVADMTRCDFYLGGVQCVEAKGHDGPHMMGGLAHGKTFPVERRKGERRVLDTAAYGPLARTSGSRPATNDRTGTDRRKHGGTHEQR